MPLQMQWFVLPLPFFYLISLALFQMLGADPAKELVHRSGEYGLWLLMLVMLATPVNRILRKNGLVKWRRGLGVAMFVYVIIHLLLYATTYLGWDIEELMLDIIERPYILVGAMALLLSIPLAVTSNDYSVRKLGRRWKKLHRLVYIIVFLVCIHIIWQVKVDYTDVLIYIAYFLVMMILRISSLQFYLRSYLLK